MTLIFIQKCPANILALNEQVQEYFEQGDPIMAGYYIIVTWYCDVVRFYIWAGFFKTSLALKVSLRPNDTFIKENY